MMAYLGTGAFLFLLGLYCLGTKHNLIKNVIGMTILFAGINLNFVYLSLKSLNLLGHFIVITVIVLEGCVIAITLAYIYAAYRQTKSLDLRKLKGV